MARVLQLVFLVSYAASANAVTQARVTLLVSELQHSNSREDRVQIQTSCKQLVDTFPKYRQAKPQTGCDAYYGRAPSALTLPYISERLCWTGDCTYRLFSTIRHVSTRAPPFQL